MTDGIDGCHPHCPAHSFFALAQLTVPALTLQLTILGDDYFIGHSSTVKSTDTILLNSC